MHMPYLEKQPNLLCCYTMQSMLSDPGTYAAPFAALPKDLSELVTIIQGLFLHPLDVAASNVKISALRYLELNARSIQNILTLIHAYDQRGLMMVRTPEHRVMGVCRDYALLMCAILRYQNRPARLRAGFANFLHSEIYLDGVAVEYWCAETLRWLFIDVRGKGEMPAGAFISAAKAWQLCRSGKANPNRFGNVSERGLWLIRNRMLQDLAMLNKNEVLLWDTWGLMCAQDDYQVIEDVQLSVLDEISLRILAYEYDWEKLQCLYQQYGIRDSLMVYSPYAAPYEEHVMHSC